MTVNTRFLSAALVALVFLGATVLDANKFIRSQGGAKKHQVPFALVVVVALLILASVFIR